MARKVMDCRTVPSTANCSLKISGEEEEVVRAAALHAADVHGEKDTPEFRAQLRRMLTDEIPLGFTDTYTETYQGQTGAPSI